MAINPVLLLVEVEIRDLRTHESSTRAAWAIEEISRRIASVPELEMYPIGEGRAAYPGDRESSGLDYWLVVQAQKDSPVDDLYAVLGTWTYDTGLIRERVTRDNGDVPIKISYRVGALKKGKSIVKVSTESA